MKHLAADSRAPECAVTPGKPAYSAVLVVEASQVLSFGEKAVWRRIWAIDQEGRGCYASAERLAEDLGTGARNVEKMRARLYQLGLLLRLGKGGRSGYRWLATLPAVACPTERKITHARKLALRDELDAVIRIADEDRDAARKSDHPAPFATQTPNDCSAFPAASNPERSEGIELQKPERLDGVKREIPNNRSLEVIGALTGEISVSGKFVKLSDLPGRATSAREARAVKDGGTARAGPLAADIERFMARFGRAPEPARRTA